ATMASADLLVLLSDIDGLYDAPPAANSSAKFVPLVERITPAIEAMAGAAGSQLSPRGMQAQIQAGQIARPCGPPTGSASGPARAPPPVCPRGPPSPPRPPPPRRARDPPVPCPPPIPSLRVRNGSPARSSRAASCPSTPAPWRRCAVARPSYPPA